MLNIERKAHEDEERLETNHKEDFETVKSQVLNKLPDKPKANSEILNLEKILKNLAKQKK